MDQHNGQQPPQPPPQFPSATDAPPSFTGLTPPHPSYTEMITEAIVWESMQGRGNRSSEIAISKYIDRVYTNLPLSDSSELTWHLEELVHKGYLVMVNDSYQLASALAAAGAESVIEPYSSKIMMELLEATTIDGFEPGQVMSMRKRGRPPGRKNNVVGVAGKTGKRPRGRPPRGGGGVVVGKRRGRPPMVGGGVSKVPYVVKQEEEEQKRRPGRPPKFSPVVPAQKQAHSQVNGPGQLVEGSMPMMSKRKPGRPPGRKNNVGGLGPISRPIRKRPRGRPPKVSGGMPKVRRRSASGKPMGRPRKVEHQTETTAEAEEQPKRRPGRPPKLTPARKQAHLEINGPGQVVEKSMPMMSMKKRGRPPGRKSGSGNVLRSVGKRPRGRPPRGGGGVVVVGKRRGRPPKASVGVPTVRRRLFASWKTVGGSRKMEHELTMDPTEVPFVVKPKAEEQKKRPAQKQAHSQVNGPGQVVEESMPVISVRKRGRPPGRKNNAGGGVDAVVSSLVTK